MKFKNIYFSYLCVCVCTHTCVYSRVCVFVCVRAMVHVSRWGEIRQPKVKISIIILHHAQDCFLPWRPRGEEVQR